MPPTDLGQLLDRAAHGDAEAFADFYDQTITTAYRLAQMRLADRSRSEHVLETAYLRAWSDCRGHRESGRSPQAWLMTLVQSEASTHQHSDRFTRRHPFGRWQRQRDVAAGGPARVRS